MLLCGMLTSVYSCISAIIKMDSPGSPRILTGVCLTIQANDYCKSLWFSSVLTLKMVEIKGDTDSENLL